MTWHFVWMLLALSLPFVPFMSCNKGLRALKSKNGWFSESTGVVLVDTMLAVAPKKLLSVWVFAPPFVMSLVPVVMTVLTARGYDEFWVLMAVYLSLAVMVAAFYFFYRLIYRQRAETIDANTSLSAALTQVRRYNWAKCWIWTSWLTGLFNLGFWLLNENEAAILILTVVYSAALLAVVLRAEFRTRKVQQKLTEESGRDIYTDDDEKWLFGMFYNNRDDNHFIVNRRVGMGTTINIARPGGKVFVAFILAILLSMPLLGVWMMREEFTPVRLEVTGTQIAAIHTGTVYKIDLDTVTAAYLLDRLPRGTRTNGTGMETVLKGDFKYDGIGRCRLSLDPRVRPFIVLTAAGRTYILGSSNLDETRSVYSVLAGRNVVVPAA